MTSEKVLSEEEVKIGRRRANHAALYAHLRELLALSLRKDNPTIGFHGFALDEKTVPYYIMAGATPPVDYVMSMVGGFQGFVLKAAIAREVGNLKAAMVGDTFDPALGKPRCEACEDGDPAGEHAAQELRENARAWLGLLVDVAREFYGEHLPEEAKEPLEALTKIALPADAKVS